MCANDFSGSISTLLVILLFASPSPMSPALYLILSPTVSLFCVCFAPVFRFAMSQLCLALFLLLWWLSSFPYLVLCVVSLHLSSSVPDFVLSVSLLVPYLASCHVSFLLSCLISVLISHCYLLPCLATSEFLCSVFYQVHCFILSLVFAPASL